MKKLYVSFTKGYWAVNYNNENVQLFPDMATYIKQPFISNLNSIAFDSIETAVNTVDKAIRSKNRLPDAVLMAI